MRSFIIPALLATTATAQADAPRVAVDIAPLHGLVSQVMDGVGKPDLVIPQGASPHGYAMRPSEARALSSADLVVWVGPGLTPWLTEPLETLAGDAQHLSVMALEGTGLIPVRRNAAFEAHDHAHGHDDHGHADHDGGHKEHDDDVKQADNDDHGHDDHADHDDHGHEKEADHDDHGHAEHADEDTAAEIDPHVWLDPRNASLWVAEFADTLSAMDPENAETYRANASKAQAELETLEKEISAKLDGYASKSFIVFHDSYHYFEARFNVEARAAITFSDASAASAAQLAEVREVVTDSNAACALTEPGANQGLVAAVDASDSLSIEVADAIGVKLPLGTELYGALLHQIADALTNCFAAKG